MPRARLDWGDWNAICDVCGFRFKASEMKKRWDNLMVCKEDYEHRHPQDFLRVRGDQPAVPWSRPEPDDVYILVCFLWMRTAYADLGTADCMLADNQAMTYQGALALQSGQGGDLGPGQQPFIPPTYMCTQQGSTSFPGFAISGCSTPSNVSLP